MKIGDLVRYIREDSVEDKATGYYPPIGTVGRVVDTSDTLHGTIIVEWQKGTTTNGGGYVQETDVEVIPLLNDSIRNGVSEYDETEMEMEKKMRQQVSAKEVARIVKYLCEKAAPKHAEIIRFTGARILGISVERFIEYQKSFEEV